MRQAFVDTLSLLAEKDKNIFLLTGDLGFSVLEKFMNAYPDRFYNMGVAEANMMGVASGLALEGYTVYVYSIIPFVTMRVFEQVRNDIALQKANVKIIGVGSGFTYGQLGPTHFATKDITLMRSLPGMTVVCPGDPWEAKVATQALNRMKGPAYLRLSKSGEQQVHKKFPPFRLGKGIMARDGSDIGLMVTGSMLRVAMEVADTLEKNNISARVISLHTIKPFDEEIVLKAARDMGTIFTIEEHTILGGLGSAVAEVLCEHGVSIKYFHRFGVPDVFTYQAGSQDYLRGLHGLTPSQISKSILSILRSASGRTTEDSALHHRASQILKKG